MQEYVYIQNYAKRGTLAISESVFDEIVSIAVSKINGVKVKKNQNNFIFSLHKPIVCEIKNGQLNVDLQVIISSQVSVNEVCMALQEEIAYAISSMTEFIPFSVNVKVMGIE